MKRTMIAVTMGMILGIGCGVATPAAPPPAGPVVRMARSYRFDPPTLQVKAGATVTWINEDVFTHNVHILTGVPWQSPPVRPGERVAFTFREPGEYRYTCDFHAQIMKGVIVVVP